jgi:hypothetical protein
MQPPSFEGDWDDAWCTWVLDHSLPPLPDGWEAASTGGGGGWFDPPFVRPDLPAEYAALGHFHSGGGTAEESAPDTFTWTYASAYGFTGLAAATVEVEDEDGTTAREIESPLGVFIVVADASQRAVARVRTGAGKLLLEQPFSPP